MSVANEARESKLLVRFQGRREGLSPRGKSCPGKTLQQERYPGNISEAFSGVTSELVISDAEAYAAKCKNYALSITCVILAPICKRRISLSVFDRNRYRVSLFIDAIMMIAIT